MTIRPGEFWVADILFTDQRASKKRAVLVLWLDAADAVLAAVTAAAPRTPSDLALVDWRASGLRVPSTVRLARLDCLEQTLLLFQLGGISSGDAQRVHQVWAQQIKPQF